MRAHTPHRPQRGATLVEFVIVGPLVLFILLALMQYALAFHAKSQLNYATFEAARAGTVSNANPTAIRTAFDRAMTGYHGGGTTTAQLAASRARATAESAYVRIEILSPTRESFDDFHSPALAARMGVGSRVIPNANLAHLECPTDRPGCNRNPASNASGQTLSDANLLKLRITYGIPPQKQIPLAGPFMTRTVAFLNPADPDAFRASLLAQGRIPVVTHTVMRMHSPAIEAANVSIPGPGNAGSPSDPGPPPEGPTLPVCPVTDPACTTPLSSGGGSDPGEGPGDGEPEPPPPCVNLP
ncbi:TadE/TadG family type IV pilus assembly protein [Azoarcus taiwanensis]|uniref:Pilus assembly protein n=1 Tax=Azoarcus taiwanensis TaxID=666964 RepID=A0A972J9U4_9RHOO|nr:TadE family protein [Azoarcus taiwanensis]NMG05229.1 pilus assembly protein [Azoarcus taiwanensis]